MHFDPSHEFTWGKDLIETSTFSQGTTTHDSAALSVVRHAELKGLYTF